MAVLAIGFLTSGALAEDASVAPEDKVTSGAAKVDACASDPARLGISRVVEIDAQDGPNFGSSHLDFLKDHEVVLTFDDGPMRRHTREILKALADECTRATFFMVGRMAAADPEMVKEVAAAGHTVASHTWSHLNQRALSLVRGIKEIELGVSAVSKALGQPAAPFFRFPYLSDNKRISAYVKSRHVATWWVDVDSKDYTTRNAKRAHARIMADLAKSKKGIILMHDIQPSTVGAIRDVLDDLHAKGYKVVHIVPKAPVTTVAEYDEAVDKMFKKKMAAIEANPLIKRSVVWPISPDDADQAPRKGAKTSASMASGKSKASRVGAKSHKKDKVLPWKPTAFGY